MAELKKCPFCGGEAFDGVDGVSPDFLYHVSCSQCNACQQDYKTEAEAITAWNTRPLEDDLLGALEDIKQQIVHGCGITAYSIAEQALAKHKEPK